MTDAIEREKRALMVHAPASAAEPAPSLAKVFKFWQLNMAIRAWVDDQHAIAAKASEEMGSGDGGGDAASGSTDNALAVDTLRKRKMKRIVRAAMPQVPSGAASFHQVCMVLLLDQDARCELQLYGGSGISADDGPKPGGARLHVIFARPKIGLTSEVILRQIVPQLPVVICRAPCFGNVAEDPVLMARAIATMQCHNSNGVLWASVFEAAERQGILPLK
jgi:hypothetical protein